MSGDGRQNGGLPTIAVGRALLATARGRRKLDVIMESPDPKAFVRQLPAEDLYFAIREIGLEDAAEIVCLASPGQFRAFVDLDVWEADVPDTFQVLKWLELAAERPHIGAGFRAKRKALDPEIILLVLQTQTIVHSLEENDDPVLTTNNYLRTAEGKYIIEIVTEGDESVIARRLLEDFIEEDPFTATRLFEAVRWESKAELEETALRWRTGRLRDMGFPDLEEAIRIWVPQPAGWKPESIAIEPGPVAGVPALLLAPSRTRLFLDRVVERLPDAHRPFFNEGLIYLLNCAIVADGAAPKELELARETLTAARDLLSLGLELASGGSEDAALAILGTTPAAELFRAAVTRIATLSHAASAAARGVSFGVAGGTALDSPDAEIISGLRRKRPRLYDPPVAGGPPRPGGDWRAIRDPQDLAHAETAIARARAAGAALSALSLDSEAIARLAESSNRAASNITVGQILLTAALSGSPEPLPVDCVASLCGSFENGKLTGSARAQLDAFFAKLQQKLAEELRRPFAEISARALLRFEEEIGPPCAAGGIEARYVECVLVAGPVAPPPEVQL